MKLEEALRKNTKVNELCIVKRDGEVIASVYVSSTRTCIIPRLISSEEVKNETLGSIKITPSIQLFMEEYNVPCHYFEI